MTMTDEQAPVIQKVIPGYGENPSQPPADAGGSIAEVEAAREHPTDPRLVKIKCTEKNCGKMITRKNMDQHKRNVHGIYKRGPHKNGKNGGEAQPDKPTTKRAKPTADEIVLIVVQMRWPNGVPVDKVPSLLAWQRDTERFFGE